MSDFSFVHAADLHLDSPLQSLEKYAGAPVEEARGACRAAFENLIDLALDRRVDFMVIAGDLWDGDWKSYETGLYFSNQIRRLERAGIPVFAVKGNHDAHSVITRHLKTPDNMFWFPASEPGTKLLEGLRVAIHGQSYSVPAETDNLAAAYPPAREGYFNIGLLHTALNGRPGYDSYAPCSLDELLGKRYDYWALGHVHEFEMAHDHPPVIFPGCLQGRHIRETGEKGCVVVKVVDGAVNSIERVFLDVMRWRLVPVDVTGAARMEEAASLAAEKIDELVQAEPDIPLAVRVALTGACDAHAGLLQNREYVTNDIRSRVSTVHSDRVWVEKTLIETAFVVAPQTYFAGNQAMETLFDHIEQVENDRGALEELASALDPMLTKLRTALPPKRMDELDLIGPDSMARLVSEAREILVSRLMAGDRS